jgi:hypothetical protein
LKTINIFKAQGFGKKVVEGVTIKLVRELPRFVDVGESIDVFEKEALTLADILCKTLPGGTFDRLVIELLKKEASSFVVPLCDK